MGAMRQDESCGVWGIYAKVPWKKAASQNIRCVNSVTERFGQKAAYSRPERQFFFITRPSAHIGLNDRNRSTAADRLESHDRAHSAIAGPLASKSTDSS